MLYRELTSNIIRAFYDVYNALGYGFLERVYENAMVIELQNVGLLVEQQLKIDVFYAECRVGSYMADLLVEQCVLVELKATEMLRFEHEAQLINYLRATDYEVGLLLNFGKRAQFKRKIFTNDRKSVKSIEPLSP